jgi:hypothetical protein
MPAGVPPTGAATRDSIASIDSLLKSLGTDTERVGLIGSAERARRQAVRANVGKSEIIKVGEKLKFSVRYGIIHAGEASLEVAGIEDVGGHPCFHVVSRARSSSVFDAVYRVRDRVDSWMDCVYLYSRKFRKDLREGSYRNFQDVEMDQDNRLARYQDGRVCELTHGSHDALSSFYYVRTLDLEPGETIEMNAHADRKNYPLVVVVHGRETVRTPAGTFDCLVVQPMLRSPGVFKQEGTLMLWITDDERRMPVQMKSKIAVGSISVVLTDYERP